MTTVHALERQLLEQIVTRNNLMRAWKRVKANQGAAGVDDVRVTDFPCLRTSTLAEHQDPIVGRRLSAGRGTSRMDTQTQRR